jgi:hypothetical protein
MPLPESDRAARRRLVWLLPTRGDVGAEALRTDGLPALRSAQTPPAGRGRPEGGSSSPAPPRSTAV